MARSKKNAKQTQTQSVPAHQTDPNLITFDDKEVPMKESKIPTVDVTQVPREKLMRLLNLNQEVDMVLPDSWLAKLQKGRTKEQLAQHIFRLVALIHAGDERLAKSRKVSKQTMQVNNRLSRQIPHGMAVPMGNHMSHVMGLTPCDNMWCNNGQTRHGECPRCQGKGQQDDNDRRRNWGYRQHNPQRYDRNTRRAY